MSYPQPPIAAISSLKVQLLGNNLYLFDLIDDRKLNELRKFQTYLRDWFMTFVKLENRQLEELEPSEIKLYADVYEQLDNLFDTLIMHALKPDDDQTLAYQAIEEMFGYFSKEVIIEKNIFRGFFLAFIQDVENRMSYSSIADHTLAYQTISELFYAYAYKVQTTQEITTLGVAN
ncbi:hypothetical protein WBJ53_14895 [Spirosoma sp. SC4-14]|uniref:hypothetical protein n=1 Tax=Spirosoma sp. SC4-14 TaxID=3128900 RepID=UPI0030D166A5